jgi:peptide/nickel transport system substrate-binding protein
MQSDPVGLDPHTTNATSTRNLLENVYDTLVALDARGEIVPALAESWSVSEQGLLWTFRLRRGVSFHDGTPLRAADVVFSLRRIVDPKLGSPRSEDFAELKEITAPDDTTVVLRLRRPFSPLLRKLAFTLNAIVSAEALRRYGDLQRLAIGTGPFRLVEYVPQIRLVLARHPGFWGRDSFGQPLPYLSGIRFLFLPDAMARTMALRTGAVDFIEYVPSAEVRLLARTPGLKVIGGVSTNYRFLLLNTTTGPLADRRVRAALSLAIDRQEIVDMALFGAGGVPAYGGAIPPPSPYALTQTGRSVDVQAARRLLTEAGYANGFDLPLLVTSTYDFLRTPAEVIQANLGAAGIRVTLRALDWGLFLPDILAKRFTAALFGESGLSDPDDFLYDPLHSRGSLNLGGYADPTLDALLDAGRCVKEGAERRRLYIEAQQRILQESPHIYLFHSAQYEALRDNVHGYEHAFNTSYLGLRTTWLSEPLLVP